MQLFISSKPKSAHGFNLFLKENISNKSTLITNCIFFDKSCTLYFEKYPFFVQSVCFAYSDGDNAELFVTAFFSDYINKVYWTYSENLFSHYERNEVPICLLLTDSDSHMSWSGFSLRSRKLFHPLSPLSCPKYYSLVEPMDLSSIGMCLKQQNPPSSPYTLKALATKRIFQIKNEKMIEVASASIGYPCLKNYPFREFTIMLFEQTFL